MIKPPPRIEVDVDTPKISRGLIERLNYLAAQRKQLQSESRAIAVEEKQLLAAAMNWMNSRDLQTVKKFGSRLTIENVATYPAWKQEFIRVAGAEAADALSKATTPKQRLVITN